MTTDTWDRAAKFYAKKHAREYAAVLHNLDRLLGLLNASKNSLSVQAGFIHTEGSGVLALDQKGGGAGLQETRLYLFAEDQTHTIHLITIGNKNGQSADVKLAHQYRESLK